MLTDGQIHEVTVAAFVLADLKPDIADAAYDSDKLREQISSLGLIACIKPRRNRKIATRYDNLAVKFLAFIHVARILVRLL